MSQKIASLYAEIGADTSGLKKGLQESKTGLSGVAKAFEQLTGISLGAAGAFAAVAGAIKFSISEAAEAQRVDAKLGAVLEATGGASGMTADNLDTLARAMSRMSGVDDETIKSGEAVLLTFRNIGQSVFPEATQAAMDMSAVMGQDLQSSIVQIGKALNDPIRGFSALQRVGVTFNDQQRDMITNMQNSGDLLGAQGIILQELQSEFGGAAEAMGNTYAGSIDKMKNALADFAEAAGKVVLPTLTQTIIQVTKFITAHDDAADSASELSTQVFNTAQSYKQYSDELDMAARANGNIINSEGDLVHLVRNRQSVTEELIASHYRLSKVEWEHLGAQQAMTAAMTVETQAAETTSNAWANHAARLEATGNAYRDVIAAQANLNAGLEDFYQDTGQKSADILGNYLVPYGERYKGGLETIDDVMGTNLATMNDYQLALEAAGRQYANTGDMEQYRHSLQDIKAEYGDFMTSELQMAAENAQTIYNRLVSLPSARNVMIRFDASGDPRLINFILGQGYESYLPALTYATTQTITGGSNVNQSHPGFGAASGLDMIVPANYSNDSFGPIWAQSGERVTITPPGQSRNNGATITNYITITNEDPERVAYEIMHLLERQGVNF